MKKVLSILLAFILLLTGVSVAYAQEDTGYKRGDIIQFGSYPQSKVVNEQLIQELNALLPEWDEWTSYGYYSGNCENGSMVQGDWMRYVDVTYNSMKYRAVKFTEIRPFDTYWELPDEDSNHGGYLRNTVYWFRYEPVDWVILNLSTGLLLCEDVIDSQPYSNTLYYREGTYRNFFNDPEFKNYLSDYETSSLRKWLNEDFYNTAFSDAEKEQIAVTHLNNDGFRTLRDEPGSEELDSKPTDDKVFLLSFDDSINPAYGFSTNMDVNELARTAWPSDYAKSQGCYYINYGGTFHGRSSWNLRSPAHDENGNCFVFATGFASPYGGACRADTGVRPAITLPAVITECQHSYTSVTLREATHLAKGKEICFCECGANYTQRIPELEEHTFEITSSKLPTCTEGGYKNYKCECGYAYTDTLDAKGHTFEGSVCEDCGYDKAEECSCNCHEGGIKAIFFKILNFFQRLFDKSKGTCQCGASH